jgi:transposase
VAYRQGAGQPVQGRATAPRRPPRPAPRFIGIDEIAVGRGHRYRIVVSDLEWGWPIWFGGKDRCEASLDEFYAWLGSTKCRKIRLPSWTCGRPSTTPP